MLIKQHRTLGMCIYRLAWLTAKTRWVHHHAASNRPRTAAETAGQMHTCLMSVPAAAMFTCMHLRISMQY